MLAIIKGLTGYFGHSYALIADAIESTTDVFSSLLVLVGIRYATKPADDNHPYGHGRLEPLITFIVVGFLMVSAFIIAYESVQNIRTPHQVPEPYTLVILGAIIIIKELLYRFVNQRSGETKSSALKADAWHHRSDAITSLTAFIGISIAIIFGEGFEAADDWAAILAAGVIIYNAYRIFRPALGEILDEHLYDDLIADIRKITEGVAGVKGTEKCYVRKTGMTYHVDLHVLVEGSITVTRGHDIAHDVKDAVMAEIPQIADILVHIEPEDAH